MTPYLTNASQIESIIIEDDQFNKLTKDYPKVQAKFIKQKASKKNI